MYGRPCLPLGAVEMAGLAVVLSVGVFEDDPLPSHQPLGAGGHTVGAVLVPGTCHTLVCPLVAAVRRKR